MNVIQFNCSKCGIVDKVRVDGYPFGDRLLEGVYFIVTPTKDTVKASLDPEFNSYFESQGISKKKWEREATNYAKDAIEDDHPESFECACGEGEIEVTSSNKCDECNTIGYHKMDCSERTAQSREIPIPLQSGISLISMLADALNQRK